MSGLYPLPQAAMLSWAWRSPAGADVDASMQALIAGQRFIAPHTCFGQDHGYACKLAGMLPMQPARSRHQRFARQMDLFGVEVAVEAAKRAGVVGDERVGVFMGYGGLRAHWDEMMPSLKHQQRPEFKGLWERGFREFHPFWMLRHLSNNAHALAAAELGATGEGLTLGGANGGAQALSAAIMALHAGRVDVAVVAAYDSLVQPDVLVEQTARGALTTAPTLEDYQPPYSPNSAGRVPASGAAALVLVRPDDARAAAALGYLQALDAADGSRGDASVEATLRAVGPLLDALPLDGAPLAIDGAGVGLPAWDHEERSALAARLPHDRGPWSCLGGLIGDTGAAHTLMQAIALGWCVQRGQALPSAPRSVLDTPPYQRAAGLPFTRALGLQAQAPGLIGAICVSADPILYASHLPSLR